MGRPPEGNELIPGEGGGYKSPQLKKHLWPHHLSMARMAACGATPGEIQKATGFSLGQISRIFGSPLFQAEVKRMALTEEQLIVHNIQEGLMDLGNRALEVMDEDLHRDADTPQDRALRSRTAFEVLDRIGHGKKGDIQQQQHLHMHVHKQVQDMETDALLKDVLDLTQEET